MRLSCTHRYCVAKLGINGEKGLYIYVKILSIYDIMLIFARKWGTGMGFKCLRRHRGTFTAMDVKIFFSACGATGMTGNEQELIINIY